MSTADPIEERTADLPAASIVRRPAFEEVCALAVGRTAVLLAEAARRVREAGFEIGNVAVQLVGERPRVSGRAAEAGAALSRAVGAPVSFSATTTDHLGFLGRGEGLLAVATALVYPG